MRHIRVAAPWGAGPAREPADLVHVHTTGPAGMTGFRFAARHRLPVVVTWHIDMLSYVRHYPDIALAAASSAMRLRLRWTPGEYLDLTDLGGRRHGRMLVLGRALFDRTSLIVAPSAKAAADLAEVGELPPVRVLPTPVAPPTGRSSRAQVRARLGLPERAEVVLCVGRVTAEKNPALMLRAFARLRRDRPGARLVFVGAGQESHAVRRSADGLGLGDRVLLRPPVPRDAVGDYYRMADVLAFPSTTDTQGLVLSEAESAGLPVVVADRALACRSGSITPDRLTCTPTADGLATALLRVLDDAELRENVVRAGRAAVLSYPPERYLADLLAAYREARDRAPAPC
jgi:glycosyltransferase involved in cell wall biosynthesis